MEYNGSRNTGLEPDWGVQLTNRQQSKSAAVLPGLGIVGLGVMGLPMARHLAAAGYDLAAFDLDPDRARQLAAEFPNVRVCADPADAGRGAEIVVTMLPNGDVVNRVIAGEGGLGATLNHGALVLDTSSSEPWLTRETAAVLAGRGVAMVDAPVSGAEAGAQAGELVFMVGGAEGHVDRIVPLLQVMGSRHFHLGPLGAGHVMKSLNNLVTAVTFMATGEALLVGKRAGLDPNAMIDVLNLSTGGSWVARTHFQQRIFNRAFDDPFKLGLMVKDVGIALRIGEDAEVGMPVSRHSAAIWTEIEAVEGGDSSVSRLIAGMENRAGIALTPGSERAG
jgi:3-hydroxyisobutyrate dehydrogenase